MSSNPKKHSWSRAEDTAVVPKKPVPRSRVSKGKQSFATGDGRSRWARRWRDLLDTHVDQLGGPLKVTEHQLGLCRRIATIQVECEHLEGQLSLGEKIDFDLYNRLSANMKRLLEAVGIKSGAAKDDVDLDEYLATKRGGSGR